MNIKSTRIFAESWNVAYRFNNCANILSNKKKQFNIIPNSNKYWAADPMLFQYNNRLFIFAELYDYKLCRGTIGYTEYDGNGFFNWHQIIVEEFHMSYPFIFVIEKDIYMIPETSGASQLLLYKAVQFPDKWERIKILKDNVKWVDTTLIECSDGFLGYTEQISNGIIDLKLKFDKELNIISQETISNTSKALRCGGSILKYKDGFIRVCQDCTEKYGGALLFRICDNSFIEKECIRISPEDLRYNKSIFLDGIHTYTALDNIEVIDIKTRRFNLNNLIHRFMRKLK